MFSTTLWSRPFGLLSGEECLVREGYPVMLPSRNQLLYGNRCSEEIDWFWWKYWVCLYYLKTVFCSFPCCLGARESRKKVDGLGFLLPSSVIPFDSHCSSQTPNCYHLTLLKAVSLCNVFSALLRQIFASIWELLCIVAIKVNLLTRPVHKELVWENDLVFITTGIKLSFILFWNIVFSARMSFVCLDEVRTAF